MKRKVVIWARRCLIGVGIVVAALIVIFGGLLLLERYRIAQFNRTHERVLPTDKDSPVLSSAHEILSSLSPTQGEDTLRFAAMPSFGERWFAVSISYKGNYAIGEVVVQDRSDGTLQKHRFEAPPRLVRQFLNEWDGLTDDYSGEARSLTDGTPIAFERKRGSHVTSGVGNSPCHYDVLGDASARYFSRYVPELSDLRNPEIDRLLASDVC